MEVFEQNYTEKLSRIIVLCHETGHVRFLFELFTRSTLIYTSVIVAAAAVVVVVVAAAVAVAVVAVAVAVITCPFPHLDFDLLNLCVLKKLQVASCSWRINFEIPLIMV